MLAWVGKASHSCSGSSLVPRALHCSVGRGSERITETNQQSIHLVGGQSYHAEGGGLGVPRLCRCVRPVMLPPVHCQFQGGRGQAPLVTYKLCVWALLSLLITPPSIKRSSGHLESPSLLYPQVSPCAQMPALWRPQCGAGRLGPFQSQVCCCI